MAAIKTVVRILCGLVLSTSVYAADIPTSKPTLEIRGAVSKYTNAAQKVYLMSEDELLKLPQKTITTATDWTHVKSFSGPLIRDVLRYVGAKGTKARFIALNDYSFDYEVSEFTKYDAILTLRINGKPFDVTQKGPMWVMYPLPDIPERMKGPDLAQKLIWHVNKLEVYN